MSLLSSNGNSPSPPSSSVSYSLLSGSSEQDQPTRLENQRELLKALRELKTRVPAEWHRKGRSSTLASLQYALNCVKQVRGEQKNETQIASLCTSMCVPMTLCVVFFLQQIRSTTISGAWKKVMGVVWTCRRLPSKSQTTLHQSTPFKTRYDWTGYLDLHIRL